MLLGVQPRRERCFILADGREAAYPTGWVMAKNDGKTRPTIVVFGGPGCDLLLGAVTLEEFAGPDGAGADPPGGRAAFGGWHKRVGPAPSRADAGLTSDVWRGVRRENERPGTDT